MKKLIPLFLLATPLFGENVDLTNLNASIADIQTSLVALTAVGLALASTIFGWVLIKRFFHL